MPETVAAERSDEDLMLAASRGEAGAFDALVAQKRVRAIRFCFRLVLDWDTAEDLAQEGFVRLYLMRRRYQPRAKLQTLLYEILKNLCLDELRRRRRLSLGPQDGVAPGDGPGGSDGRPEERVEAAEAALAVRRSLGRLSPDFRAALVLREFEGLDYRAIGALMGWSLAKTKVTLHRARQRLAEDLRRAGYGDGI